jgi:hypothetical protein
MPFQYNLGYNSSVWYPTSVSGTKVWTPVNLFGWGADTEAATGFISFTKTTTIVPNYGGAFPGQGELLPTCSITTYGDWTYYDPLGISHAFNGSTQSVFGDDGCPDNSSNFTEIASDGSGYTLNVSIFTRATIASSGGKTIVPASTDSRAGTVTDSNGNEISVDTSGHFTDTTGNVALTIAGTAPSAHTFTYKDTSGNSRTVTMSYQTYTVQTAFGCSGIAEYGPTSQSLVSSISFPDGSAYNFTYEATPGVSGNVTGRLAGIELPQGGTIQYSYSGGSNGIECADGSAAGLTRTLNSNSGSAASTWTYSRTSPGGTGTSHTEVVDGLGNHKAYDFVEASNQPSGTTAAYYETNRSIYQGAASGTPVVVRHTCYNTGAFPCTTRSHLINAIQSMQNVPQGLKPAVLLGILRHG